MIRRQDSATTTPLALRQLSVAYGAQLALEPTDWDVVAGARTAICGPNGAGKSSLLRAALGLERPLTGTARFFGLPLAQVRQRVAYVPQRDAVDWTYPVTALDVVTTGRYGRLGWFGRLRREDRQHAHHALDRVGLGDVHHAAIGELSGGQQQRVFLARALCSQADLLLLDEPFRGIDVASTVMLNEVLSDFVQTGRTAVVVHHDLESVARHFDRALLLNSKVLADGPVERALSDENLTLSLIHI